MRLCIFLLACLIDLLCCRMTFAAPPEIVVAGYNVQNYSETKVEMEGRNFGKPKSSQAIDALLRVIKDINPDILGICEMGRRDQFESFKARLKTAGFDFSDSEFVQAADADRHLALLSRFPIVARESRNDISYDLNGVPEKVKRGFLDVTIRINSGYDLRVLGAHLKSRLSIPEGEALMRRAEAQLLRKHIDEILIGDPQVNLLLYGDFNATIDESPIREIMGVRGSPAYMVDLQAADVHGDRWTHYWRASDQYARLDYLFVNRALLSEVIKEKSRVYRSAFWNHASDHRPIYTSIIPVNRKR